MSIIFDSLITGSTNISPLVTIELTKDAKKQLNEASLKKQVDYLVSRALAAGREKRGYNVETKPIYSRGYGPYRYYLTFIINFNPKEGTPVKLPSENDIARLISIVNKPAKQAGWTITKIDDKEPDADALEAFENNVIDKEYYDFVISEDWRENFSHLYGLDAHINIIKSAIDAAQKSAWLNRFHICLYGEPGCGKSDLALSVLNMLGRDAVLEFDATSTTMAGATKELFEREEMPRVLLVEEIEKADENSLRWLLSLMDIRGSVRKLTARSKMTFDTKLLCIATVNDIALFRTMLKGALASRFAHQLFCKRPTEEILRKILTREIDKVNGDPAWIEPTIAYCTKLRVTDPRAATAICLTGCDDLITGKFQAQLDATREGAISI